MLRSQVVSRSISFSRAAPALTTAALWFVLAAGVAYWVLHFPQPTAAVLPGVSTAVPAQAPDTGHTARALGQVQAETVAVPDSNRFQLLGVIASASGRGSALIAIDGQAPKAWRVGQAVQEGVYLQKLSPRQAWLGQTLTGPSQWALQMTGPGNTP
jgi:general secretion pathway protein C